MKDWKVRVKATASLTFISHMVQMKACNLCEGQKKSPAFISHMVQMKVWWSNKNRLSKTTLYPTWFRWKGNNPALLRILFKIFISHMVQMKGVFDWFCQIVQVLYIPHGSDESRGSGFLPASARKRLYIPHGSDESGKFLPHHLKKRSSLYPTWFRWKW